MYDTEHAVNVAQLSVRIGEHLGLNKNSLLLLYVAGLFHDIGKMLVPEGILEKPSALSQDEYKIIQQHTTLGHGVLSKMPDEIHSAAAQAALYHHERLDGSGYLGLSGEKIPLFARIIAVADVYDALTTNRPYRKAWENNKALAYMQDNTGSMFDAGAVAALSRPTA